MERSAAAARTRELTELYDPGSHEPLTEQSWDEGRARAALAAIVADAEAAFSPEALWPLHPLDREDGDPERATSLYLGAAGMIWALTALERAGAAGLGRDWPAVAASLPEQFRREPDYSDEEFVRGLWMGEAGVLLVAHGLAPAADSRRRCSRLVRANRDHPSNELAWGAPGTMLAAQVMHERTGDPVWAEEWRVSADRLWELWDGELRCLAPIRASQVPGTPASGARRCAAGRATCSARPTASPATCSSSRAGTCSTPRAARARTARGRGARERTRSATDGLAQWPPALEPLADPAADRARSGATARPGSSRRSRRWRRRTSGSTSCSSPAAS